MDNREIIVAIEEASRYLDKGDTSAAESVYLSVRDTVSEDAQLLTRLANLSLQLNDYVSAIVHLTAALKIDQDNAILHDRMAHALMNTGYDATAKEHLDRAIELDPNSVETIARLGIYENEQNNLASAISYFERAIELKPSSTLIYEQIIPLLITEGRQEQAREYAKKLLRIRNDAMSMAIYARTLIIDGEIEEAGALLEKAIKKDPLCSYAYFNYVSTRKFTVDDMPSIRMIEKNLERDIPTDIRSIIHFCLGKVYDDLKDWDVAIRHYDRGNILAKPGSVSKSAHSYHKALRNHIKPKMFDDDRYTRNQDTRPLFIVGMPRTGSTLTEQILSSHPGITGVGESLALGRLITETYKPLVADPRYKMETPDDFFMGLSRRYLELIHADRTTADRIIDKNLMSYLHLGLIHMMFPNAQVIHVRRNPLDTCLSCYFQSFDTIDWANSFEHIAEEYDFYRSVMSYWEKVLPEGTIINIDYEDIVADIEGSSRKMLDAVGMEWDERCIEFNTTEKSVSTASHWQVRQPLYKTSSRRWMNYAEHIAPLARALGNYLSDEDIEALNDRGIKIRKGILRKLFN